MKLPLFLVEEGAAPARLAILEAGLHLFTTRGLSATTVRDLAEETGFTNPALYRHFPSKDALALHLFEKSYAWMGARTAAAVAGQSNPRAQLRAFVETLVLCAAEAPEAVLFANDHLRELWPLTSGRLMSVSLVRQADQLVRALRGDRRFDVSAEMASVALLGTFGQWARALHFKTLPGPATRWRAELLTLAERIIL